MKTYYEATRTIETDIPIYCDICKQNMAKPNIAILEVRAPEYKIDKTKIVKVEIPGGIVINQDDLLMTIKSKQMHLCLLHYKMLEINITDVFRLLFKPKENKPSKDINVKPRHENKVLRRFSRYDLLKEKLIQVQLENVQLKNEIAKLKEIENAKSA